MMQPQPPLPQPNHFILEEYRQCYESKKHYDNLSWTIATVTLVLVGPLVGFLAEHGTCIAPFPSVALRVLGTLLVWVWFSIYERNRFWAEVANERARDIERGLPSDGLAIQFMIAHLTDKVILKNVDSTGKLVLVGGREAKQRTLKPHSFGSMHIWIWVLMLSLFLAVWGVGWSRI